MRGGGGGGRGGGSTDSFGAAQRLFTAHELKELFTLTLDNDDYADQPDDDHLDRHVGSGSSSSAYTAGARAVTAPIATPSSTFIEPEPIPSSTPSSSLSLSSSSSSSSSSSTSSSSSSSPAAALISSLESAGLRSIAYGTKPPPEAAKKSKRAVIKPKGGSCMIPII